MSERPAEEVSEHERQYEDGSDPRVLDIMDVPLKGHHPKGYQSENWLLDPDYYWKRAGRVTCDDLDALADDPVALWVNGFSTGSGSNDRVGLSDAALLGSSLYLLYSDQLQLRVFAPGTSFGNLKRRVQAEFSRRGIRYRLWATDPLVERKYLTGSDGEYPIGECFVTVSLGEPHEGYCYKLVAALITPDREIGRSS